MFFQQHQQQQDKLIEIIRRVKTASLYRDAYGRPVQTAIGSTDVIPLAQAAQALGVVLPKDLRRIPGRTNQYPIGPVMQMVDGIERMLASTMGMPPVQVGITQAPQFVNTNPGAPVFNGYQAPPPGPQFQQPATPPSPYPENPYFQPQPPSIQPVQPDLTNVITALANQVASLQQGMAAMQMAITSSMSSRGTQAPPPPQDQIDDEILAHLGQQAQPAGRRHNDMTVAEQLGLIAPGSGIPALGDADEQQLASALAPAEEDDTAPVRPSRTPENMQGKNEAPEADGADDVDPLAFLQLQTGEDDAVTTKKFEPSPGIAMMSFKQLEVEMKSRGIALAGTRTKQSMIEQISKHDMEVASQIV